MGKYIYDKMPIRVFLSTMFYVVRTIPFKSKRYPSLREHLAWFPRGIRALFGQWLYSFDEE